MKRARALAGAASVLSLALLPALGALHTLSAGLASVESARGSGARPQAPVTGLGGRYVAGAVPDGDGVELFLVRSP